MDKVRLRLKIRDVEFEAEGPEAWVREHLADFKASTRAAPPPRPAENPDPAAPLNLLFHPDRGSQSLTLRVLPSTDRGVLRQTVNTLLLVLYGFHESLGAEKVPALSAARAIRQSGMVRVHRLSNAFLDLQKDGLALKLGTGKGTRYQLTAKGRSAAQTLIHDTLRRAGLN